MCSLSQRKLKTLRCLKSVRIWSYSGPYFPAFGLNTERYCVYLRIQCKNEKIRTRKTLNTDTFHEVLNSESETSSEPCQTSKIKYQIKYFAKIVNGF